MSSNGSGIHTAQAQGPIGQPLQVLNSPTFINISPVLGDSYRYYWMDGNTLRTIPLTSETAPLVGSLYFAVPYQPTMADFAASGSGYKLNPLHEDLIKKVIEVVTGPGEPD